MSDVEQIVLDLAQIAAAKKLLADVEKDRKDALQAELSRGTVYAYTGDKQELGYASVPKPTQPKPVIEIADEARAFGWVCDTFGEDSVETVVRLTEQGRKSLDAAVLLAHETAGKPAEFEFEGVSVRVPEARPSTPRFTPAKNVVELVQQMARAGELSFSALLEIGERP